MKCESQNCGREKEMVLLVAGTRREERRKYQDPNCGLQHSDEMDAGLSAFKKRKVAITLPSGFG